MKCALAAAGFINGDIEYNKAVLADTLGKCAGKAELPDEPAPQANAPAIVDFQPYMGKVRKPGTGCISQINDHLFEGRYSPTWIDGKKHARNVYAHTREECEEKLKALIEEMKAELAELKRQKGDRH